MLQIGDRVQYSQKFLRSTGMYTGEIPRAVGTLIALDGYGYGQLATVDWDIWDVPRNMLAVNLAKVGSREAVGD